MNVKIDSFEVAKHVGDLIDATAIYVHESSLGMIVDVLGDFFEPSTRIDDVKAGNFGRLYGKSLIASEVPYGIMDLEL